MAEFTAPLIQTVEENDNVLFTDEPVCGSTSIVHRDGSGLVTLKGITGQCKARFKIVFSGNIAIAEGGTVDEISIAIAVDGEELASSTAIVTPAAAGDLFNVASFAIVDVPRCCCSRVSVENTSAQAIDVQNANLIIERIA